MTNLAVVPVTPITLTPEQSEAINSLMEFLSDPSPDSRFFTLAGFAGTGKTFCMREVVARSKNSRAKFAFTAPTNKAAKVLRAITGEAQTIFSLLGLRIDKTGELKQLVAGKAPPDLSDYTAIFVDEGSMVNKNLFKLLHEKAITYDLKVIFMGDAAQLPPVGEASSPIWTQVGNVASLTKVMRHDNQILTLATELREVMNDFCPSITIKSSHSENQGVWKVAKNLFKQSIYDAAVAGDFSDGSKSKVIAWRNARVSEYNILIRNAIFGAAAQSQPYIKGDRIVAAAPCMRGEDSLLTTDEEAIVEGAVECNHPLESKYRCRELSVRTEANKLVRLLVLHEDSAERYAQDSEKLAYDAKATPRLWKKFWEHKDLFHDIKYAYALTAHRSQGSTYENVWVDYQDILINRNRKEAFQCLYVACTRPTTKLILA
jgi:exodeoxyribonuclease-5